MQVELPRHMYVVALEEHLLLEAYRHLCSSDMSLCCPPDITLASRNDLIALAAATLSENCLEVFLSYAETLCRSLPGPEMVDLPPPVGDFEARAPAAEQLAWHYLQEGRGSLWTSVRAVTSLLNWEGDGRSFAQGLTLTLGMFSKGGLRGLTRHTKQHINVCRLFNRMIAAICPSLEWSSITLTLDNNCSPHVDKANRPGKSLLVGLTHHESGGIWIANGEGQCFAEHGAELLAGDVLPTSARGVLFDAKSLLHSTCEWTGGNRIVLIAYCVGHFAGLSAETSAYLSSLGFVLPLRPDPLSFDSP